MRPAEDPGTAELLAEQLGLITRAQLIGRGWPAKVIDGAVRRRHLEVVHRGVYRCPGSARPDLQPAFAAVLRAGPSARVTGEPVLQDLRLPWLPKGSAGTVLLPPPRRLVTDPVRWRPDRAPDHDHHTLKCVPATSPARAFVEVADTWTRRRQLTLADQLRWDRLATDDDIIRCAQILGPRHPGARAIRELVARGDLRQESHGERDLAAGLSRLGLSGLVRWQVELTPTIRVDCLFPLVKAVLEYDGKVHHTHARDRAADARRDREIEELGYGVIRITKEDLVDDATLRRRLERELGIDLDHVAAVVP